MFLENYGNLSAADQATLAPRKGEILFLRSYAYYLITNTLGSVPLILQSYSGMPENFAFPKASLEAIYKQIIGDLRTAVTLLPDNVAAADLGRISKPAAAHFLAKLYLHRAQAAGWANSSENHLKMLYKGNVGSDLDSAIYFSTMVIDMKKETTPHMAGFRPTLPSFGRTCQVIMTATTAKRSCFRPNLSRPRLTTTGTEIPWFTSITAIIPPSNAE